MIVVCERITNDKNKWQENEHFVICRRRILVLIHISASLSYIKLTEIVCNVFIFQ